MPTQPTWLTAFALAVDLVGVLAIAALIYAGKVTPSEGLPWMALLLGFTRPEKSRANVAGVLTGASKP